MEPDRLTRYLIAGALATGVFLMIPSVSPLFGQASAPRDALVASAAPARQRPPATEARGLYMTGWSAGGDNFDDLVGLIGRTELNSVVLDIKDEHGQVSWLPKEPVASAIGGGVPKIVDPRAKVAELKRNGIYVIGRIVVFRDPVLAEIRPDLAVRDTDGGAWRAKKGVLWADPYSPEVWRYNLALADEAVRLGFDEIQFDYIRFPADGDLSEAWYAHRDARAPAEVIDGFLAEASRRLVPQGVYVSADLFGLVTLVQDDLGIGQRIEHIAHQVDYVSLMLYPSHYNKPEYGLRDPEREPYKTVALSLADAKRRMEGGRATLRPWLQDFTLNVPYTPVEVREQIRATGDAGIGEWILWNARNRYSEDALVLAERADNEDERKRAKTRS